MGCAFPEFSSAPPGNCRKNISDYVTTAFFHILSTLLFTSQLELYILYSNYKQTRQIS
jgi:hypothetical protein